jgi:cation diffusion facilitator family transporter
MLQGGVSIVLNLLLFAVKGVLGLMIGSVALLADAVHSLSDVGSSLVVVLGCWWARQPRDSRHPFGHGRVELVTALVMAVLLVVLAIEFTRAGIGRILDPRPYVAPGWMIAVVAGTMALKHWLSLFARTLARATQSPALLADYWHHVADVMSTALVLFALGASRAGWVAVDGWAGLGVALFLLHTGVRTAREAISPLLGEAPAPEEVRRIEATAAAVPGVRGVHDLILHRYGDDRLMSLHIEVDAGRSALAVHDISERVEAEVERAVGGKAIVHVDPVDRSHPQYRVAEDVLRGVVDGHEALSEFHDLRVEGPAHKLAVSVDVVAVVGTEEAAYPAIAEQVGETIRRAINGVETVRVTVDTGYHAKP